MPTTPSDPTPTSGQDALQLHVNITQLPVPSGPAADPSGPLASTGFDLGLVGLAVALAGLGALLTARRRHRSRH